MVILKLFHLPVWWYKDSLNWFKRLFKNLLMFLDNKLAFRLMIQMLIVPMFHDTSLLGRILSLIYRLIRITVGLIVMSLTVLTMGFWLIIWLITPILLVIMTKEVGLVLIGLIWVYDSIQQLKKPLRLKSLILKANGDSRKLQQLLIQDPQVLEILTRLEIAPQALVNMKGLIILKEWLQQAVEEARRLKDETVDSQHLLLALLKHEVWRYKEALITIEWLNKQKWWGKTPFLWEKEYLIRPIGGVDRALTGVPTVTLDKYSTDWTKLALKAELPEIIGKTEALDQMAKILSRTKQNNLLVIGEPGSGKTTLVKGMAQEIVRGVKAKSLKFKRLIALDTTRLAAGANSAELNYRISNIIEEIKLAGNIILFVDEVHNLASINQDTPETSNLFTALEPPLSDGAFQFIGATSTENYKKYIEPNEAFARLFEVVELKEAGETDTLACLEYLGWQLEKSEAVTITTIALKRIIDLAGQYIYDRVFPDKAVNLLDEVVAIAKSQEKNLVISTDVEQLVTKKTKIPLTQLTQAEKSLLLNLEKKLHRRVIGQDQAIKAVADAIRRARTKLKDPNKPIASFLFSGPTGVGKTETAKTLAEEFFGSEKVMIRLDMSEYQNLDSLNRLIGAPPGSGDDSGGQLTEAVRHQPYSLLLLDEIEKAHLKIVNLFLQVLDDARLTDSNGRVINFANTIIIATTNVGTKEITVKLSQKPEGTEVTATAMTALENYFAPEFLNRFTGIIVFKPLTGSETEAVVELKLKRLTKELEKQEIRITFKKELIKKIAAESFSTKWGGRQADRTIQEQVMNVIAKKILEGKIVKKQPVEFSSLCNRFK